MYRFWGTLIEPILEALKPAVIVEIGSDKGQNTRKLLTYCHENDSVLHVIDPSPDYPVKKWKKLYGKRAHFHQETSLEGIKKIGQCDMLLIDGDHNWYTVYHELSLIVERSSAPEKIPVILLHDIGWPYGRRDMYYDPATIPEEYLKRHAKMGLRLNRNALSEEGGLNRHLHNATEEKGLQNGVLSGVEDFLHKCPIEFSWFPIAGLHGLGILISSARLKANPSLKKLKNTLRLSPALSKHLEAVEQARLEEVLNHRDSIVKLNKQRQLANQAASESRTLKEKLARNSGLRERLENNLQDSEAACQLLNERLEKHKARLAEMKEQLTSLKTEQSRLIAGKEEFKKSLREKDILLGKATREYHGLKARYEDLQKVLQSISRSRGWRMLNSINKLLGRRK